MNPTPATYCGRFAPSPTGPLHAGSLLAAVASYLDARHHGGRWLVRIDDIDAARTVPGASDAILSTLDALGLRWDGEVTYQSGRAEAYCASLKRLKSSDAVYPCSCTRSEIARLTSPTAPGSELRYPGLCRQGPMRRGGRFAWRLRVAPGPVRFVDTVQGQQTVDVAGSVGDFVLQRSDGPYAYQLAVVVDDADAGVTHVVRGQDLLENTPRHLLVQRALGLPSPTYGHVPVLVDANGNKLAKSSQAAPVNSANAPEALWLSLRLLRQNPPREIRGERPETILAWATPRWTTAPIAGLQQIPYPEH